MSFEKIIGIIVFFYSFSIFIINDLENFTPIILVLSMVTFFLLMLLKQPEYKIVFPKPWILLCSFFALGTYSLLWIMEFHSHVYFNLLHIVVASFVIINYLVRTENYHYVINGILISLWTSTIIFFSENDMNLLSYRPTPSTFENPNTYAFALTIGLLLLIYIILQPDKHSIQTPFNNKWLLLITYLVFSYQIIFVTGSRKAFIVWFILKLFLVLGILYKKHILKKYMLIIIIIILILTTLPLVKNSEYYTRVESLFSYFQGEQVNEYSINVRGQMRTVGVDLWKEKPLFGWGIGQYRTISGYETYSHNNYIEILSNNGLLGFALFYGMFVLLIFRISKESIRQYIKNDDGFKLQLWFMTIIIVFLFWDYGAVTYYDTKRWLILSCLIAMNQKNFDRNKPIVN